MTHRSTLIRTLAAGLAWATLASASPAVAATPHGLGGTWKVAVTLVDCTTRAGVAPPFTSLLAFAGDGIESETTNNPALQPGQRSPAFGVWTHVGGAAYHLDTFALILFASTTPRPIQAGSQQIHQDITLAGDGFSSVATLQFFDASGAQTAAGCATATASRLI